MIKREVAMEADPDLIDFAEYRRTDMTKAAPDFWDSLDEASKLEFLTDSVSHLTNFSRMVVKEPWLVDFLSDAITFFDFYGTWEMYLCPDPECLRLFRNDESLINHLKCEHFPKIHPVAWPPRRHNIAEERRCADALRKMVWKPIVVEPTLDMLSSMCLDYQHVTMADVCSGSDQLYSLNWLYSDDPKRKSLLVVLEKKFQILVDEHERASFSLLSKGYLTTMIAMASNHIFVGRPDRDNKQFLQELLARSPLSFCLLEAADLDWFVELVDLMCQFVQQATNRELDSVGGDVNSVGGDVNWGSENLGTRSFSQNDSLLYFPEAENLRYGDREFTRESILSLLCHGPWIPTIPRVPPKAYEIFSRVKNVLNELRVPVSTESYFQGEQNHLQLVHRVQCLESQLRQLCNLDCRVYIVPLMRSFLRMKLYFYLRCRRLKAREEDPAALCPTASYQEEHIKHKASSEESESEYDSDYEESDECEESISNYDLDLDYKPWRDNPTLCSLDSTLSESATGETEGSGPFFWLAISDVLRHCEKNPCGAGYESVQVGIKQFRLNKTWKYWLCYHCYSTFIDRESHMVHLENEHQLSIGNNEYWLIPQQDSGYEGGVFRQDVVMRELGLEDSIALDHTHGSDSITLDHTYDHFLVDSTNFYATPSANEEEELDQEKHRQYRVFVHHLQHQLTILKELFQFKRQNLTYLEVVKAIGLMLCNGCQPLSILVSWLWKLSTVDCRIGTTHQLQFRFLSNLLDKGHTPDYGLLSNYSVFEAFKDTVDKLTSELCRIDHEIPKAVDRIDIMKRYLSDFSECDYRMKIVPSVRSFLHAKFKFDKSLRSLECNNVKELLSTLDPLLDRGRAYSFKAGVPSPGKVVINTMEKSSWAFAFIGIQLSFVGKWSFTGETELTGVFNFGGWSNWSADTYGTSGSVVLDDRAIVKSSYWHILNSILCDAVGEKLLSFTNEYGAQIRCHGVVSVTEAGELRVSVSKV